MKLTISIPDDVTIMKNKIKHYEELLNRISLLTCKCKNKMYNEMAINILIDGLEDIVTEYNEKDWPDEDR